MPKDIKKIIEQMRHTISMLRQENERLKERIRKLEWKEKHE